MLRTIIIIISLLPCLLYASQSTSSDSYHTQLLDILHSKGITKCDRFIPKRIPKGRGLAYYNALVHPGLNEAQITLGIIYDSKYKKNITIVQSRFDCTFIVQTNAVFRGDCDAHKSDYDFMLTKGAWKEIMSLGGELNKTYTASGNKESLFLTEVKIKNEKVCIQQHDKVFIDKFA